MNDEGFNKEWGDEAYLNSHIITISIDRCR